MSTFPPVSPQDGGGNDDTMFSLKTSKKSEAPQNSRAFSPSNKFQPLPLFVSSNIKAGRSSVSSVSGILDSNGIASSSRPVTNQSNVLKPSKPASLFQQQNPDVFRPTTDASFRNSTPQSPLLLRIPVSYQSSPYLPMSPIASLVQASSPTIGSSIAPSLGMPSPTLPNRHGGMSPKFFDTAHNHYGRRSAKREKNVFQDLLEATRKSMSAGMGEWDLQSVEWSHDEFREHLLKGPLGPETLKNVYRMSEGDIFKLYRALYTYSVGFCSTVTETTKKAQHQEQLLDSIIEVYAQLWDEVMGISFKSDLVDDLNGVKGATAALQQATARLAKYQEENSQLQARLNDFVKGSVDRSVQYKQLDDKARELEGEAVTLSLANEKMSIRVAGAEIQVQALSSQLELKEQNIKELRACFEIQDAANQRLKAALREQQSTATRQYFQIVELEKALAEARRATQDVEVEAQKAAERYAAGPKVDEATWERRMADKTLAYNLLHSDYVVKMHDLNELRIIDAKLNQQVALMEDTYNTAKRQIEQSKAQTEKYRRRWENGRMFTADVESANRRQASRIRELVKSYWPLTSRLKEAEAGMKRLRCESDAVEARSREVEAQMMVLRSEVADHDRLVEEMKRLKAEMSLDHVKLSEGCMAVLHPDAESARAYVRTTQRRIQDLTKQLVRLVDVHAGAEDRIHKHQAAEEGLKLQLQQLENVLKGLNILVPGTDHGPEAQQIVSSESQPLINNASADKDSLHPLPANSPPESLERYISSLEGLDASAAPPNMMVPPFLNPALTPEQLAVKLATAKLEGWLGAVAQQLSSVTAACEVVLSRDPDAPISHVQQQLLDVEISAAAAARGTPLAAVTDLKDKLPPLAIGRLAQTVGALSEAQPMLVLVDWQWEQFSDCMERMKAWGNNLLDKKLQVQHLVDIRNQLAASQAALSTTQVEVDALQKELVAVKSKAEKLEAKIHEDEAETHRIKLGAAEQEANRSALEVGLSAAREEVASLTSRLTLLEEEYWGAKAKVLEAEMVRGEIMAAKDRAVLAAEEAVAAMKKMESETSQHRIMREKLVLDLIACKAWIRSMGDMDKAHRKLVLDLQEAQDAARKDKQLVFELRSKISNLEDQVQLSAIHTKSSQEQVQALLRDLQAAEAAGGGDSNALAQAHAVAAAEVGRLRVEVSSLVTRVRAAEAAAVSSSRGQEAAKEEAERALSEAKEAADRAWLVEQRMTELRAVVAGTKIHAENIEEQIRHLEGDKEILGLAGSELQAQLAEKETQGVSLQREVWDLSVALHEAEVERKLILEKAVDQKFEPSEEALKNSAVLK